MENDKSQMPALFHSQSQDVMMQSDGAAVARATQEIQASLLIAARFPRDEIKAETRILQACQRKSLAEVSQYEYSRGGTRIVGPTIDLLRAIANRWGNLTFGWSEAERTNGQSTVRCWAWDLQSNSKAERTFVVRHWRDTQAGGYAIEDERDIYELLANMASRRVRACLEEVIDADIVDKAIDQCHRTLKDGETIPLKDRATKMVLAFAGQGITKEMIEKRLGNTLEAVSENQLASLRRIFKALVDGVGKREDYFKPTSVPPNFSDGDLGPQTQTGGPRLDSEPVGPSPKPVEQRPKTSADGPEAQAERTARAGRPSFVEPEPSVVAEAYTSNVQFTPSAPAAAAPAPAPSASNLRILRDMMRIGKVKDGQLLDFWASTGMTDGSATSLEEVAMAASGVIGLTIKSFADIASKIKAAAGS